MNNKKIAIAALVVVLLAGLLMYLGKEEAPVQAEQVEAVPPVAEPAPAVTQEVAAAPVQPEVKQEPKVEAPTESLGASSSGLGR